jgi:hypothetical protein
MLKSNNRERERERERERMRTISLKIQNTVPDNGVIYIKTKAFL